MFKKKYIIFIPCLLIIALLLLQQYNYICNLTNKCNSILLSYYLPTKIGKQEYRLFFSTKNDNQNLIFSTELKNKTIKSGEKISVSYVIKNISNNDIKIKLKFFTDPMMALNYIKMYDCNCAKYRTIKANQTIKLKARFHLNKKIENDDYFSDKKNIKIQYEIL